jgi:hypothetical protein
MFKSLNELEREVGGEQKPLWKRTPLPLKFFILFGFVSYTVPMYLTYSPLSPGTYPRPGSLASFVLAYSVCRVCILMPTVDPTPSTMAYFVGPIDALIHGAVGALSSGISSRLFSSVELI